MKLKPFPAGLLEVMTPGERRHLTYLEQQIHALEAELKRQTKALRKDRAGLWNRAWNRRKYYSRKAQGEQAQ